MNRGALSGGAPDGSPALSARTVNAECQRDAISAITTARMYLGGFDNEIDQHPVLGADDTLEPPADMFDKRFSHPGKYTTDDSNELVLRGDLTAHQVNEINAITAGNFDWRIDATAGLSGLGARADLIAELGRERFGPDYHPFKRGHILADEMST